MIDSFWTGGPDAYEAGLSEQYEALLRDLRARRERCANESACGKFESELQAVEVEYRRKVKHIKNLLF